MSQVLYYVFYHVLPFMSQSIVLYIVPNLAVMSQVLYYVFYHVLPVMSRILYYGLYYVLPFVSHVLYYIYIVSCLPVMSHVLYHVLYHVAVMSRVLYYVLYRGVNHSPDLGGVQLFSFSSIHPPLPSPNTPIAKIWGCHQVIHASGIVLCLPVMFCVLYIVYCTLSLIVFVSACCSIGHIERAALRNLLEKICANKSILLEGFLKYDPSNKGLECLKFTVGTLNFANIML